MTERGEARRAETRERIVAAAHDQLAEGGYASAAVAVLARRAGVATGTVYRHFPSKTDLFAEVFRRASQREVDAIAAAMAGDGRPVPERVAAGVETFARRALAAPTRAWALIAEPVDPAVDAERLAFRRAYRDVFDRVLREGVERGELAAHDTGTVAAALVGAIGEALVGPLSPAGGRSGPSRGSEALVAGIVQFCLGALPAPARAGGRLPRRGAAARPS